jgi:hypothetical protein
MPQPNDLSRSLVALDQDSTIDRESLGTGLTMSDVSEDPAASGQEVTTVFTSVTSQESLMESLGIAWLDSRSAASFNQASVQSRVPVLPCRPCSDAGSRRTKANARDIEAGTAEHGVFHRLSEPVRCRGIHGDIGRPCQNHFSLSTRLSSGWSEAKRRQFPISIASHFGCRLERPWREEQQFPAALQETLRKMEKPRRVGLPWCTGGHFARIENQSHARPDPRRIIG